MKTVIILLLYLIFICLVGGCVYLIGAFCMLQWDYVPLIDSGNRGAMVCATLLFSLAFFFFPLMAYEEWFE